MEPVQAIGGTCFLLMSAALSVRLLQLAYRNRAVPELLLGVAFLLGGTLGAILEAGGLTMLPDEAGPLLAVAKAFGAAGIAFNAVFTWYVFRRGDAWALPVLAVVVGVQGLSYAAHFATGTFATGVQAPQALWLEFIGRVASPLWLGIEAGLYWSRMRRRARIGLSDPLVQNRFLLWSLASATGVLLLATSVVPNYVERGTPAMDINLAAFGLLGIATSLLYWLAFFPPSAYRRRLTAAA